MEHFVAVGKGVSIPTINDELFMETFLLFKELNLTEKSYF